MTFRSPVSVSVHGQCPVVSKSSHDFLVANAQLSWYKSLGPLGVAVDRGPPSRRPGFSPCSGLGVYKLAQAWDLIEGCDFLLL